MLIEMSRIKMISIVDNLVSDHVSCITRTSSETRMTNQDKESCVYISNVLILSSWLPVFLCL